MIEVVLAAGAQDEGAIGAGTRASAATLRHGPSTSSVPAQGERSEWGARLMGLNAAHELVFDFQYASPTGCGAAWNAVPLALENLQIR
ncbi:MULTISPECIES: hypothetical protein [unclassified Rhizobacter]|uniref:hypothetical protein n=1 Tax=unclassified Rhizobacter TaxID=2640088 RepID=UPI0012FC53AB|nr:MULTISPECIES: hypothetical protein [unclassified Rhizobacter]